MSHEQHFKGLPETRGKPLQDDPNFDEFLRYFFLEERARQKTERREEDDDETGKRNRR